MLRRLFQTDDNWALAVIRVVLGIVIFAHGAQKMLGWFGGRGFHGYMTYLMHVRGVPGPFAFLAIAAEFFGSLGLILGFLGRIAAFGIAIDMVVAVVLVHLPFGFFMNWNSEKKGEGFEFQILVVAMAVAVMIGGAGPLSLDRLIEHRFAKNH